jgi:hypothetical protein
MTEQIRPPEAVVSALRSSGFPFQTAIAHAVAASPGWRVTASEYPWQGPGGETHFLDLVATNGTIYLTIECKKTRKEAFTFLRPLGGPVATTGLVHTFRCLHVQHFGDSNRTEVFCEDWALDPRSTVSEFCVVSTTQSGKDQRLLERDAGLLIRATDVFAHEIRKKGGQLPTACLVVPVIVTNAPIYTARYKPSAVSLETGEFTSPPTDVTNPACARFQKQFTSDSIQDLGDRTVFVVNALSFVEFLGIVGAAPMSDSSEKTRVMFQRLKDLR